jgi:hypothetical protein
MKLIIFLSIAIIIVACNPAKQANRNAYNNTVVEVYPQVQFDSVAAKNMLAYGNTNIEGVLYARRDATEIRIGRNNRVFASDALVTLFPVTPYFEEWYRLRKKQSKLKRVYMSNEAFRQRITTTTDAYGRFVFDRMKPGKYFVMANVSWTDYRNANVEVGRDVAQTGTQYITQGGAVIGANPIYNTTIYTQNMTFASDKSVNVEKFVTVSKTSGTVKLKMKGIDRN